LRLIDYMQWGGFMARWSGAGGELEHFEFVWSELLKSAKG